jgi:hypothetical protein
MRGFKRRLVALAAMATSGFSAAPPAQLQSASDYVPAGSCAPQVAQLEASGKQADVAFGLEVPWTYRFDDNEMAQTPRIMQLRARLSDERGLGACAYRTAAARVESFVQQRAPSGLKHFVTTADCTGEQAAYASAVANDVRSYAPRVADSVGREMATAFVEGVAYLHVLGNRGRGMSAEDYKAFSKPYDYSSPRMTTGHALRACLFSLAYQRGAASQVAVATTTPSAPVKLAPPPQPADPCSGDTLGGANRAISDVDARLDRFMSESPYAKAEGSKPATPMLQVTIWALERNIAALKEHCPASQKAREHIADFETSLKHAQEACDQIQVGAAKCVGVEPERVM